MLDRRSHRWPQCNVARWMVRAEQTKHNRECIACLLCYVIAYCAFCVVWAKSSSRAQMNAVFVFFFSSFCLQFICDPRALHCLLAWHGAVSRTFLPIRISCSCGTTNLMNMYVCRTFTTSTLSVFVASPFSIFFNIENEYMRLMCVWTEVNAENCLLHIVLSAANSVRPCRPFEREREQWSAQTVSVCSTATICVQW